MIRKFDVCSLKHEELRSGRTGEAYSLSAILTEELGFRDVFVHHEIIPPGRRSSGTHFHSRREELVFVVEGRVTAWCNDVDVVLEPGEFVGFPPGASSAHHLTNETEAAARVLVISSNPDGDEVQYP